MKIAKIGFDNLVLFSECDANGGVVVSCAFAQCLNADLERYRAEGLVFTRKGTGTQEDIFSVAWREVVADCFMSCQAVGVPVRLCTGLFDWADGYAEVADVLGIRKDLVIFEFDFMGRKDSKVLCGGQRRKLSVKGKAYLAEVTGAVDSLVQGGFRVGLAVDYLLSSRHVYIDTVLLCKGVEYIRYYADWRKRGFTALAVYEQIMTFAEAIGVSYFNEVRVDTAWAGVELPFGAKELPLDYDLFALADKSVVAVSESMDDIVESALASTEADMRSIIEKKMADATGDTPTADK